MHQAGIPPALAPEGQVLASRGYLLGWESVNIIPNNWILSLLRLGPCLLLCFPRKLQEGSQVMLSSLFCLPHTEEAVPLLPGLFFVSYWELQVKELLCPHSLTSKIKSWVMITPMVFLPVQQEQRSSSWTTWLTLIISIPHTLLPPVLCLIVIKPQKSRIASNIHLLGGRELREKEMKEFPGKHGSMCSHHFLEPFFGQKFI